MGTRGKKEEGEAYGRLADRIRKRGVRVDVRLGIIDLLAAEHESTDLRDELDRLVEKAESASRDFAREIRGN